MPIQKIHPNAKIARPSLISRIFFLERKNDKGGIKVSKVENVDKLAARLAFVNLFERNYFYKEYYRYAYMFGVRNAKIEKRFDHDYAIILSAFKKTKVFKIDIPKKIDLTSIDIENLIL